jgi:hypothetical protein
MALVHATASVILVVYMLKQGSAAASHPSAAVQLGLLVLYTPSGYCHCGTQAVLYNGCTRGCTTQVQTCSPWGMGMMRAPAYRAYTAASVQLPTPRSLPFSIMSSKGQYLCNTAEHPTAHTSKQCSCPTRHTETACVVSIASGAVDSLHKVCLLALETPADCLSGCWL